MFDLDEQIAAWRQQMLTAGVQSPVPLEELENHLREDVRQRVHAGASEYQAFEASVTELGHPKLIEREFKKTERNHMKPMIKITAGVSGVLVGMAFVMPAVAQCLHEGVMKNDEVPLYTLGMALTVAGVFMAFRGLKKRRA